MPPLKGFSDNAFETRDDVICAAEALLRPLLAYFSPGSARVKVPQATGTHFDETAAQLEGFTRPLWVVGALLIGGSSPDDELIQPWIKGLQNGTDPSHPEFWGDIHDYDQRMVEAETISFALLATPKQKLWAKLSPQSQKNIIKWLSTINDRKIHLANWLWFRVMVNLALLKTCGVDTPQIKESLQDDLENLDKMYMTDGWSSDGIWRSPELDELEFRNYQETGRANTIPNSRNACYYSGSFAIQFSQLLYLRFASELDPQRTKKYRQQARDFGAGFWRFFDAEGGAIPFGRSLTYRFACGGFFAALALANVPDMPAPLESSGAVKGFLLRHLRWWARHSDNIFRTDGTLDLGWTYPNMYLTEDYNSPQSVYWALKSLVVLGLAEDDVFWAEPETPFPQIPPHESVKVLPGPRQLLCNRPESSHHFLLSPAQFIGIPFKAVMAKYSKFAYSSAFGFSVPTGGHGLGQIAPDSVLALSRDGTETWAVKYKCDEPSFGKAIVVSGMQRENLPTAKVRWYPWVDRSLAIDTTIIPPSVRWPDWHIRVHRLKATQDLGRIFTAEGGFALNGRQKQNTQVLPVTSTGAFENEAICGVTEGIIENEDSVLIMSDSGASGVATERLKGVASTVSAFKPEPNSNIMVQRSLIPLIENSIPSFEAGSEVVLMTKVFAMAPVSKMGSCLGNKTLRQRWFDQPEVLFDANSHVGKKDCIVCRG